MNPLHTDFSEAACARQLATKQQRLRDMLAPFGAPDAEVFPSPPVHYRQRAEFRVRIDGPELHYLMFAGKHSRDAVRLAQFPVASRRINALMAGLRERIPGSAALRERLWQVEFLDTLAGESLLTLVYHRRLDEHWENAARDLAASLGAQVLGRSRGQRIVLDRDGVTERLAVGDRTLTYRQPEGCFTQPNAEVNRAMLGWADAACTGAGGDLLELYCGIGNFTAAVGRHFGRVLATEIGTTATAAARHNLAVNGVEDAFIARLSAAEAASAIARERPYRRLAGFDLEAFHPGTLLVDPPRAGLDAATLGLARGFRRILYVSCNPASLCENLDALGAAFRIRRAALFDQFPYTDHMECGILLERDD